MSARLDYPLLYVVADLNYAGDEARWLSLLGEVAHASVGRPVAIQVRAKGTMTDELARRARAQVPRSVPLLLNGEKDLATRAGYDGVHWPEAAIPAATRAGVDHVQIAAVHSVSAARRAEAAGVDAVVFGSVYLPGSKEGSAAGLEALSAVTSATTLPVIAIGGITPGRVAPCLEAGARGVAVVSGVLGATSPGDAIEDYVAAIRSVTAAVIGRSEP